MVEEEEEINYRQRMGDKWVSDLRRMSSLQHCQAGDLRHENVMKHPGRAHTCGGGWRGKVSGRFPSGNNEGAPGARLKGRSAQLHGGDR
ncbi:hypothetical protein COCON_G00099170 [Conger conger]|uniref:Uncharacterized protein n=1 Tax=Conger conger TaxID=82655 RepID=A0A9Q1DMJ2_CONCO|nr:hypothetical protein COCON_G00099170 [Conger conger]